MATPGSIAPDTCDTDYSKSQAACDPYGSIARATKETDEGLKYVIIYIYTAYR